MKQKETKKDVREETAVFALRRRARWPVFLLLFLAAMAALVYFAPRILSTDIARHAALAAINSRIDGEARVESWFFSWNRGISFDGIRFTPGASDLSLEADGITLSFTIPDMAQAAYAFKTAKPGQPIDAPLKGGVNIFRGRIRKGVEILVSDLNALSKVESLAAPFSITASARSALAGGLIDLTGNVHLLPGGIFDPDSIKCSLALKITDWNAAATTRIISKGKDGLPDIAMLLSGVLNANMDGVNSLDADGAFAIWPASPTGDKAAITGLDSIELELTASRRGTNLTLSKLVLDSESLSASASGSATLTDSNTMSAAALRFEAGTDLRGTLRVLAVMLPEAPFAALRLTNENEKLTLDGEAVISMAGRTNLLEAATLNLNAELRALEIEPFIALAQLPPDMPLVKGVVGGRVSVLIQGTSSLKASGTIQFSDLAAAGGILGTDTPFLKQVALEFDVKQSGSALEIAQCSLSSELVEAHISGSTRLTPAGGAIPDLDISATGQLHAAEAAKLLPATLKMDKDFSIAKGSLDLAAVLASSNGMIVFDVMLSANELAALRGGREVAFPHPVSLSLKGSVGEQMFNIEAFELTSSALSLRGAANMNSAKLSATADLAEISREAAKFVEAGGRSATGMLTIETGITLHDAGTAAISLRGSLSNSTFTGMTPAPIFANSARLELKADAEIDGENKLRGMPDLSADLYSDIGTFTLRGSGIRNNQDAGLSIETAAIKMQSSFARLLPLTIALGGPHEDLDLSGDIAASMSCSLADNILNINDLDIKLAPFAFRHETKLSLDKSLRVTGRLSTPRGGSRDERLANTSVDFLLALESANLMGMRLSGIKLPFRLHDARAELDVQTAVNEGTLLLPLRVNVAADPLLAEIPDNTRVLQGVQITDEMVNEMLAFISPLLRGCAVSTGSVSAQMNKFRFPFGKPDPSLVEFDCITSFRNVSFASAGLLFDILSLVNLQGETLTAPDQDVRSTHRNGRIYTEPLTLKAGGFDIIISGSAGLDGTLDYVARLPFTPEMVGESAYRYLQGQSIILPITGTVKKPEFDKSRFLTEAARTAATTGIEKLKEKAAGEGGDLIEKGVQEGEKLLKKWLSR